jgi:hypothetical protein
MTDSCWLRQLVSLILALSFSCATFAVDTPGSPRAVLHSSGKVQVNGTGSRDITTLFSGDSIQTDDDSVANITAGGSSVLIMPGASVKYLGTAVELTSGGMSVATSEGMVARADGLTITPGAQKLSKYEVAENEDSVVIAARQGNVTVTDGQQTSTVHEGQQTTHKRRRAGGADPAATGTHSISGKTIAIVGGASGATIAGILIAESSKKKKCVSPSGNKKCKCKKDKNGNEDCEEE